MKILMFPFDHSMAASQAKLSNRRDAILIRYYPWIVMTGQDSFRDYERVPNYLSNCNEVDLHLVLQKNSSSFVN